MSASGLEDVHTARREVDVRNFGCPVSIGRSRLYIVGGLSWSFKRKMIIMRWG